MKLIENQSNIYVPRDVIKPMTDLLKNWVTKLQPKLWLGSTGSTGGPQTFGPPTDESHYKPKSTLPFRELPDMMSALEGERVIEKRM